mgnify:CR=1 FL=1
MTTATASYITNEGYLRLLRQAFFCNGGRGARGQCYRTGKGGADEDLVHVASGVVSVFRHEIRWLMLDAYWVLTRHDGSPKGSPPGRRSNFKDQRRGGLTSRKRATLHVCARFIGARNKEAI